MTDKIRQIVISKDYVLEALEQYFLGLRFLNPAHEGESIVNIHQRDSSDDEFVVYLSMDQKDD